MHLILQNNNRITIERLIIAISIVLMHLNLQNSNGYTCDIRLIKYYSENFSYKNGYFKSCQTTIILNNSL
jgi:hypothetical protein